MGERTEYEPGTPCWIDLSTPDQVAAADFYGALFGWSVEEGENPEATGGYRVARKDGKGVGGVMKTMEEGQPPAWMTYISVSDVDETTAKAREAGGAVLAEPMTVLDYGRMAVVADPTGAVVGLWQPGTNRGAELVNEPGSMSWNELNTRDPDAAKAFYGAVFGWEFEDLEFEGMGPYVNVRRDGGDEAMAGMLDMNSRGIPDEVPSHWQVYFAVDDADETVGVAEENGGHLGFGPFDIPAGRFAIVSDPFGAHFAVIALSQEMREKAP
jgi:predicted enzyme related to lactoylglutathione lyase